MMSVGVPSVRHQIRTFHASLRIHAWWSRSDVSLVNLGQTCFLMESAFNTARGAVYSFSLLRFEQ